MQNASYGYSNTPYMYTAPPQPYGAVSRSHSSRYEHVGHSQGPYALAGTGVPVIPPQPANGVAPRPRHQPDRSGSDPSQKPLKSAMKKPHAPGASSASAHPSGNHVLRSRTVPAPSSDPDVYRGRSMEARAPELSRGRSASGHGTERSSVRAASLSRHRSLSRPRRNHNTSGHIILCLSGTNRLKLSSILEQGLVDDIRERVLGMWPDGLLFQAFREDLSEFDVRFYGKPWSTSGQLGVMAMKMILELFAVLGRQGYLCTSAIDTGRMGTSPKLVFTYIQPDPVIEFSMIAFSSTKRKFNLINHKDHFCKTLVDILREAFPHGVKLAGDDDRNDRFNIEMNALDFDRNSDLLSATILQHATFLGLKLEGAIPIAHSGFFSFLHRKRELWIFRGLQPFAPGLISP